MNTTTTLRSCFSLLLVAIFLAPPVSALDYPLSSEAIREAYFLGSGDSSCIRDSALLCN
jgi:hypothetical protein